MANDAYIEELSFEEHSQASLAGAHEYENEWAYKAEQAKKEQLQYIYVLSLGE